MKQTFVSSHATATLGVSTKRRNDYADYDYLDKLDLKSLNWLKGFNREYVNADFKHNYKKLYKNKTAKRAIYNLNNARNRCLYNLTKATFELYFCYEIADTENSLFNANSTTYEDFLIAMLDNCP